jgi:hypothetical protein
MTFRLCIAHRKRAGDAAALRERPMQPALKRSANPSSQ